MNYSFEEQLEILREETKLNPIDYLKVLKERKAAEQSRDVYIKYEPNDIIGTDYSKANALEYNLRMRALENMLEPSWRDYLRVENDGYGLSDYARSYLNQQLAAKNQEQRHR